VKFVSSRDFRVKPGEVWEILKQGEDVVVTSHGKPFGVLVSTKDNNIQQLLSELVRLRARLAVSSMRQQAQASGLNTLSQEKIGQLIQQARRSSK
jgi:prevent-host-death family protein